MHNENETPDQIRMRLQLQRLAAQYASMLKAEIPDDVGFGFALILADLGAKGNMAYASTINRQDMMAAMRELLGKVEIEQQAEKIAAGERASSPAPTAQAAVDGVIETLWKGYERKVLPADASAVQRSECRRAFYAGAAGAIMNMLDPGKEPTESDLRRMSALQRELKEFND